uniref:DUF19 domain-containing protein n=1 Tax=Macrostomum lignano TaxID=282301 RepID=A0A1I8IX97_9PLAT
MVGRFVFDCVVECPEWHGDRHWNELDCCSSNNCNTGEELREQTRCYVSKGRDSSAYDEIQMCNKPDRCAVNIVTRETRCVTQRDCTSKLWACCRDEGCLNKWGVEKVTASSLEESSNAADLLPSAAPVLIGLIAQLPPLPLSATLCRSLRALCAALCPPLPPSARLWPLSAALCRSLRPLPPSAALCRSLLLSADLRPSAPSPLAALPAAAALLPLCHFFGRIENLRNQRIAVREKDDRKFVFHSQLFKSRCMVEGEESPAMALLPALPLLLSLPALLLSPVSAAVTAQQQQRCNIGALWRTCKRDYGAKDLFDGGYNFGWQPFNLLRQMCHNRTHVKSLKCLQDEATRQCTDKMDFTHIMILSVYNYNLYARAADYICERHNYSSGNAECLWLFLQEARYCSRFKSVTSTIEAANAKIGRAINDTKHNTQTIRTDMDAFLAFIRRTVEEQLCDDRLQFLNCVERELLRDRLRCPNPIVMLVVKYYSQLMPDWCRRRSYEPLADLMADQRVQQAGAASSEDASPRQVGAPSPAYSARSRGQLAGALAGAGSPLVLLAPWWLSPWRLALLVAGAGTSWCAKAPGAGAPDAGALVLKYDYIKVRHVSPDN